jgi:hypothetical protein
MPNKPSTQGPTPTPAASNPARPPAQQHPLTPHTATLPAAAPAPRRQVLFYQNDYGRQVRGVLGGAPKCYSMLLSAPKCYSMLSILVQLSVNFFKPPLNETPARQFRDVLSGATDFGAMQRRLLRKSSVPYNI